METVLGLLIIVASIVLLVVIGFAITWLTGIITKKNSIKSVGKIGIFISGGILLVLIMGTGVSNSIYNHQLKIEAQAKSKMNENFRKEAKSFKTNYIYTAVKAEDLGNTEDSSWGDAIDDNTDSADDFDVDQTVSDILDDNSSDIEKAKDGLEEAKSSLNKLKKNDTGKYSYDKYDKSYIKLRRMVNFVSSPSGSYSTFGDKFSDLDNSVSEAYEGL